MPCDSDPFDMQFLSDLSSAEIPSNECLSKVRSLLTCPTKITAARSFRGNQAQIIVDFLDRVLAQSCLDGKLRQRCLRLLSKICKANRAIPASYILQEDLVHVGEVRYRGGCADVSDGEYEGCAVAIKRLGMNDGDYDSNFKRLCREIIGWKHLLHPNILPLKGVSVSLDPPSFFVLSEWMPDGNVMKYARSNPEANRLRLLSEAASGVAYLHNLSIVHGDIKGANVLVDTTGTARVADFGLMTMVDLSTFLLSETVVTSVGTFRWMSPELLDPPRFGSNGRPTRESDCYALGMTIYEVLTGRRPFHNLLAYTPVPTVLGGGRPERPREAESLGFSHTLWELVQWCWSASSSTRPTAQQLLDYLSPASLAWVPPQNYPARIDGEGVNGSGSSGSSGTSAVSSRYEV